MSEQIQLSWRESLPLKVRWKLKYLLGRSEREAKDLSFWLYWKLCPKVRGSDVGREEALALDRLGVSLLQGRLDSSTLESINSKLEELKNDDGKWLAACRDGTIVEKTQLGKAEPLLCEHVKNIDDLLGREEMCRLAESVFGPSLRNYYHSHYRILSVGTYLTYPGPPEEPTASFRWHADEHPPGLIKGFVYLKGVSMDQGPFCCLPGSHKAKLSRHEDKTSANSSRFSEKLPEELSIEPKHITGEAGSGFLINANMAHRATTLVEGERRTLCFMFLPSVRPPEESLKNFGMIPVSDFPDRIHEPVWHEKNTG